MQKLSQMNYFRKLTHKASNLRIIAICIIIGALGRVLPHLANFSPFTNLSVFASRNLNRAMACITILFSMLVSDSILFFSFGYRPFFMYSLFTYSGFLAIAFFGKKLLPKTDGKILIFKIWLFTCGYWIWTNLGVWFVSNLYPKNLQGLFACYIAALPFLRNAFVGDAVWALIIFGCYAVIKRTNLLKCEV
jgi:hypothetical protein